MGRRPAAAQDWDWLVRASAVSGVSVRQLAEPLVVYTIGSTGSMSASPDWRSSFEWATRHRSVWADATLADFLASQTLRYALQGHDWSGAREIICDDPRVRPDRRCARVCRGWRA